MKAFVSLFIFLDAHQILSIRAQKKVTLPSWRAWVQKQAIQHLYTESGIPKRKKLIELGKS